VGQPPAGRVVGDGLAGCDAARSEPTSNRLPSDCPGMLSLSGRENGRRRLDPEFAAAHAALGYLSYIQNVLGLRPVRDTIAPTRAALLRALELDPGLPEAHAVLGTLAAVHDYDWPEATRRFDHATATSPVPFMVRTQYSYFLAYAGRAAEGADQARQTVIDDPLNAIAHHQCGYVLDIAGYTDESERYYLRALELNENLFIAHEGLAMNFVYRGRSDEALASAERAHALAPWNPSSVGILAGLRKRCGDVNGSERLIEQLGDGQGYGAPIGRAICHALCDESDAGAEWLEKAIEQRDPRVLVFVRLATGRVWRASSRWPALARILNLPAWGSNDDSYTGSMS
jgi:tetratricopeptide (TPR) repeat protein